MVYCRNFFQLFPSRGCWAWKFIPRLKFTVEAKLIC